MEVKAKLNNLKISPRKVRIVVDLIRGMKTNKAIDQLQFMNKNAALPVMKLVKSAIANAEHNFELDTDNLLIKEIRVDESITMKRWMPRAHGRATPIRKRTSHVYLTLSEIKDSGTKVGRKAKIDEPVKLGEKPKEDGKAKVSQANQNKSAKPVNDSEIEEKIVDPKHEAQGGHAKIEGKNKKGFTGKLFRRKSG